MSIELKLDVIVYILIQFYYQYINMSFQYLSFHTVMNCLIYISHLKIGLNNKSSESSFSIQFFHMFAFCLRADLKQGAKKAMKPTA